MDEHEHRPDDDPRPGDWCKDCGRRLVWIGPSPYDWELADTDEDWPEIGEGITSGDLHVGLSVVHAEPLRQLQRLADELADEPGNRAIAELIRALEVQR